MCFILIQGSLVMQESLIFSDKGCEILYNLSMYSIKRGKNMSLLDTIKNIFCKKSCHKTQAESVDNTPEVVEEKEVIEQKAEEAPLQTPEDSMLKRHFLSTQANKNLKSC